MRALIALALFAATLLAACSVRAVEPKLDAMVITMGWCSLAGCKGEHVKITSANRFSYGEALHSEASSGTASFANTLAGLRRSGFFGAPMQAPRYIRDDPNAITIYVRGPAFDGQRDFRSGDPGYAATRAFVDGVLRPVRAQAARGREREAERDRPAAELMEVNLIRVRLAGCPYIADFKPPAQLLRAEIFPGQRSFRPGHATFAFERIRALAARFHLNQLYHNYPEPVSSNTMLQMTLTYRGGPYDIIAGEPDYWPQNLRDFVAIVDALVPQRVPSKNCGIRV